MQDVIFLGVTILFFNDLACLCLVFARGCVEALMNAETDHHADHLCRAACISGVRHVAAGEILMTANGWLQILAFFLAVFLVTKAAGAFMARVFSRERTWLDP